MESFAWEVTMGTTVLFYAVAMAAAVAVYLMVRIYEAARVYVKVRGKRLVTCPENLKCAAVGVDARRAAREAFWDEPRLRLRECSRWPERQDCGQACLKQIQSAPEECLVRNIVTRWYAAKACASCGRPIHEIDWLNQKPALLDREGKTVTWDQVAPEKLPDVFSTHSPVCWSCHIAQTFRREHADLVVERPWRWRT